MAPPLDRKDLHRKARHPLFPWLRLPRRTRRTTYLCLAILALLLYITFRSPSDSQPSHWQVPSYFEAPHEMIPIQFPELYHTMIKAPGTRYNNKNVIFVAHNITAASKMTGIACEMAEWRRNDVHIALTGPDTISVGEFRRLNGLPEEEESGAGCRVYFHDARPKLVDKMTLDRRKVAVKHSLRHIGNLMSPQAILVDPAREDEWFIKLVKEKTKQLGLSLVQLPKNAAGGLRWLTRVDSGALKSWNRFTFEVIIYADSHTGNLKRLLGSLANAFYPSPDHYPLRITIYLDPSVRLQSITKELLKGYAFPSPAKVIIRRSIAPKTKPSEVAQHFVESFYTVSDDHSVLFLDPNTELSPYYYHYLLYTTLEYRYARYAPHGVQPHKLFGIALEQPTLLPNGDAFPPLGPKDSFFLHPAPSVRATLFFPGHWSEFNAYYSHKLQPRTTAVPARNATDLGLDSDKPPRKLDLSESFAETWQAVFLELARIRGYVMLYPALREALAVVHGEVPSQTYPRSKSRRPREKRLLNSAFPDVLPERDLVFWTDLPVVDAWGERSSLAELERDAMGYRAAVSSCKNLVREIMVVRGYEPEGIYDVEDLFCDEKGERLWQL